MIPYRYQIDDQLIHVFNAEIPGHPFNALPVEAADQVPRPYRQLKLGRAIWLGNRPFARIEPVG